MDYSLDWLLDLKKSYLSKHEFCLEPSDWNICEDKLSLPSQIILDSHVTSASQSSQYSFMYSEEELSEKVIARYITDIKSNLQASICSNATVAIFLALKALTKRAKRLLVITPVYFSVLDSLKDFDGQVIYFHLLEKEDFEINFASLHKMIKEQFIEAIIVTDPIYSLGKEHSISVYEQLGKICLEEDCWLFVDHTLGGLNWNTPQLFPTNKLELLKHNPKILFVDSITKKLLINGCKSATIISSNEVINEINMQANHCIGGLTKAQVELTHRLFDKSNNEKLVNLLKSNLKEISNNYKLLNTILLESEFHLANANSGLFVGVFHKELKLRNVDIERTTRTILFELGLSTIPLCRFSYFEENPYGFRINMAKSKKVLLESANLLSSRNFDFIYTR